MKVNHIHSFNLAFEEMQFIQTKLKNQIEIKNLDKKPSIISGIDITYFKDSNKAITVMTTLNYDDLSVLEKVYDISEINAEYQSGYLAFKEIPSILKVWEKATIEPDIVFLDGNGLLHQNRMGLASHISFFLDKPTVGISKNIFMYDIEAPLNENKGSYSYIKDNDEILGVALRTSNNVKPVYVSIGNQITLEEAIEYTMHTVTKESRIPSITRLPDMIGRELRAKLKS